MDGCEMRFEGRNRSLTSASIFLTKTIGIFCSLSAALSCGRAVPPYTDPYHNTDPYSVSQRRYLINKLVLLSQGLPPGVMDLSKWKMDMFGDLAPVGDPSWYQGNYSPYYNASHMELREFVREFVDEHIMGQIDEWDNKDKEVRPDDLR